MRSKKITLIAGIIAVGTVVSIPKAAVSASHIGIGSGKIYQTLIANVTQYIGECTGYSQLPVNKNEKLLVPFNLLGNNVPKPEKGLRVRVINRSNGGAYTDRKWDKKANRYLGFAESQPFHLTVGQSHQTKRMVLSPGENDLVAVFYKGKFDQDSFQELGVTEFSMQAKVNLTQKQVSREWSKPKMECVDRPFLPRLAINSETCPGTKQKVQYLSCPVGSSGKLPEERKVLETIGGSSVNQDNSYQPPAENYPPDTSPESDYDSSAYEPIN